MNESGLTTYFEKERECKHTQDKAVKKRGGKKSKKRSQGKRIGLSGGTPSVVK